MKLQVRINGNVWLPTIGGVGSLRWSTIADGGCEEASWTMQLSKTFNSNILRTGALVEILAGPLPLWSGLLNEPDVDDSGHKFSAIGFYDELHSAYLCFDAGLNTTSVPNTAVDQAIARGLPCTRPVTLSSSAFAATTTTDELNYVGDLLDAWADSVSKRWRVNADRTITADVDPTSPKWMLLPTTPQVGLADDDYASNIYLRFKPTATTFDTATVSDTKAAGIRRREYPVDATSLGVTTSGNVTNIGNGMMAKGKARFAWTDGITPGQYQLMTAGGQPASLALVKAGDMVRSYGFSGQPGDIQPYYDWIIGRAEFEAGSKNVTLAPTKLAARNLGDVLALAVS